MRLRFESRRTRSHRHRPRRRLRCRTFGSASSSIAAGVPGRCLCAAASAAGRLWRDSLSDRAKPDGFKGRSAPRAFRATNIQASRSRRAEQGNRSSALPSSPRRGILFAVPIGRIATGTYDCAALRSPGPRCRPAGDDDEVPSSWAHPCTPHPSPIDKPGPAQRPSVSH